MNKDKVRLYNAICDHANTNGFHTWVAPNSYTRKYEEYICYPLIALIEGREPKPSDVWYELMTYECYAHMFNIW